MSRTNPVCLDGHGGDTTTSEEADTAPPDQPPGYPGCTR